MKLGKLIFLFALSFAVALPVQSKRAMKGLKTVVQPDGSTLSIRVAGDEHSHFIFAESGELLCKDNDGFYRLGAIAPDGAVVSSGIGLLDPRAESVALKAADLDLQSIAMRRVGKRRAPQSGLGMSATKYPVTGNPKGLIILVEFSDLKFTSQEGYDAPTYFNEMINGENFDIFGGTGSARQYFADQSGGKFIPDFDVLGPVTLPEKMVFYGANDRYGEDENPHLMVTQAIEILDADIDFSRYDNDGDGVIDSVYVFYAGQGEADFGSDDTIWPHAWDVRYGGVNKNVDGVTIGPYACSNEWDLFDPSGVGTFIHEFSHVMGLPDLYHTWDANAVYTPDEYSVLDYGPYNNRGRTPPNYGAYEKNALGWFDPIMLDEPCIVSLKPVSTGKFCLIPTEKDTEFFLLENRQLEGWDEYIPNHGMLIWHIDYVAAKFENNVVNNTKSHQYVDIVEANDIQDFNYSDGYTFPGTSGNSAFTSSTTPALKSWSGKPIDIPITNITEAGGMITFDVSGGEEFQEAPLINIHE